MYVLYLRYGVLVVGDELVCHWRLADEARDTVE